MTNENKENLDCLMAIYGGKSFLKIYQALEIGKMKFSFAEKENAKNGIDIYVDADIFEADLIHLLTSGEMEKRALNERARKEKAGDQYCKSIWESPAGVGKDGQTVKKFDIQPGLKTAYAFRCTEGKTSITVGVENRQLRVLCERWRFLKPDYEEMMRARYNLSAMKNNFHSSSSPAPAREEKKTEPSDKVAPVPTAATPAPALEANRYEEQTYLLRVDKPITEAEANGSKYTFFDGTTVDGLKTKVLLNSVLTSQKYGKFKQVASISGGKVTLKGTYNPEKKYISATEIY